MVYLHVYAVPCEEEVSVPLPEGLVLVEDFVSVEEEALLLAAVDWLSANDDVTGKGQLFVFFPCLPLVPKLNCCLERHTRFTLTFERLTSLFCVLAQKALKHRRVKHYGFEFRYDNNNVDKHKPLTAGQLSFYFYPYIFSSNQFCVSLFLSLAVAVLLCLLTLSLVYMNVCLDPGIPQECLPVLERCVTNKLIDMMPDQLTVNQYESGQGEFERPCLIITHCVT